MEKIQLTEPEKQALKKVKADVEAELQEAAKKLQEQYQQLFQQRLKGALEIILLSHQLNGQYLISEDMEYLVKAG